MTEAQSSYKCYIYIEWNVKLGSYQRNREEKCGVFRDIHIPENTENILEWPIRYLKVTRRVYKRKELLLTILKGKFEYNGNVQRNEKYIQPSTGSPTTWAGKIVERQNADRQRKFSKNANLGRWFQGYYCRVVRERSFESENCNDDHQSWCKNSVIKKKAIWQGYFWDTISVIKNLAIFLFDKIKKWYTKSFNYFDYASLFHEYVCYLEAYNTPWIHQFGERKLLQWRRNAVNKS